MLLSYSLTIFLFFLPSISQAKINMEDVTLDQLISVLKDLLTCIENTKREGKQLYFGLALSIAQLDSALELLRPVDPLYKELKDIERRCRILIQPAKSKSYGESQIMAELVVPEVWEQNLSSTILNNRSVQLIPDNKKPFLKRLPLRKIDYSDGRLDPNESDICFFELLKTLKTNNCTFSSRCLFIESASPSTGYSLTHQVLFWQLYRALQCNKKRIFKINFQRLIADKCLQVLLESLIILKSGFNSNEMYNDLFLEQVGVCASENYVDFLSPEHKGAVYQSAVSTHCLTPSQVGSDGRLKDKKFIDNEHFLAVIINALATQIKNLAIFNHVE